MSTASQANTKGMASVGGGAATGAAIGTVIAPGVGTLIGASIGSLVGSVAGSIGLGNKAKKNTIAEATLLILQKAQFNDIP